MISSCSLNKNLQYCFSSTCFKTISPSFTQALTPTLCQYQFFIYFCPCIRPNLCADMEVNANPTSTCKNVKGLQEQAGSSHSGLCTCSCAVATSAFTSKGCLHTAQGGCRCKHQCLFHTVWLPTPV